MKNNASDIGKLILRLVFGGFMLTHGYPKLLKLFSGNEIKFADPLHIGDVPSLILTILAEFVFAIFVIIGFKTKWFSIPLVFTMIVAAFVVHGADPLAKKEMAILYAAAFAVIALIGPGKYSIDRS